MMRLAKGAIVGSFFAAACITTAAQADEQYVIGLTADLTGPASTTYQPLAEGARAYIEKVNAEGGVNGRSIRLRVRDSRSDPSEVVGDVNYFDDQGVLGNIFVSPSGTLGAYAQTNASAQIPTVYINACYPPATPPTPDPNFFCPGLSTLSDAYASVDFMIEMMEGEDIKMAFVTTDIPGARGAAEQIMKPYAEQQGVEVFDVAVMPVGTTDAGSIARRFDNNGVNAVVSYTLSHHMLAGAEALTSRDWDGKYLLTSYLPGVFSTLEDLREPNIYAWDQFSLPTDGMPVHEEMRETAEDFGFDFHLADLRMGYRGAMTLVAALEECGWPCDRDSLREVMNHLTVDNQEMLDLNLDPVVFTPTNHTGPYKTYRLYHWSDEEGAIVKAPFDDIVREEVDWE